MCRIVKTCLNTQLAQANKRIAKLEAGLSPFAAEYERNIAYGHPNGEHQQVGVMRKDIAWYRAAWSVMREKEKP